MKLVFISLIILTIIELSIYLKVVWKIRELVASVVALLLSAVVGYMIFYNPSVTTMIISFFSLFRLLNLFRLVQERINPNHLYYSTRRSSLTLTAIQVIIGVCAYYISVTNYSNEIYIKYTLSVLMIGAVVVLFSTLMHLRKSTIIGQGKTVLDRDLPTVTIAIPARNETEDLDKCLTTILGIKYPKLEVIVLDDCSQYRKTPDAIKAYANKGVRFIAGMIPPNHWLAKNYAYKQLVNASSGEILLFCGVDSRFSPESVRTIIELMLARNKSMISIIPVNSLPVKNYIKSIMLQTSRYAWEMSLPRKLVSRPSVLSTCWVVKSSSLMAYGGFESFTNSISPESYFARAAIKQNDGYSFLSSPSQGGVSCDKQFEDQFETAIRTRYPQLHKQPEVTSLIVMAELTFLVTPIFIALGLLYTGYIGFAILAFTVYAIQSFSYFLVVKLTYRKSLILGLFLQPLAAFYDVIILLKSMLKYEFGSVVWKERNVCVPVMNYSSRKY